MGCATAFSTPFLNISSAPETFLTSTFGCSYDYGTADTLQLIASTFQADSTKQADGQFLAARFRDRTKLAVRSVCLPVVCAPVECCASVVTRTLLSADVHYGTARQIS